MYGVFQTVKVLNNDWILIWIGMKLKLIQYWNILDEVSSISKYLSENVRFADSAEMRDTTAIHFKF